MSLLSDYHTEALEAAEAECERLSKLIDAEYEKHGEYGGPNTQALLDTWSAAHDVAEWYRKQLQ